MNILIVEDDPFAHDFYRFIFKKAGHQVIILEESERIIEVVKKNEVSFIIMDINLKNSYLNNERIDGIFLSRYIKQHVSSEIPILLVSAYSASIKGNKFLQESLAEDFILKPIVDINLLLEKINILAVNGKI